MFPGTCWRGLQLDLKFVTKITDLSSTPGYNSWEATPYLEKRGKGQHGVLIFLLIVPEDVVNYVLLWLDLNLKSNLGGLALSTQLDYNSPRICTGPKALEFEHDGDFCPGVQSKRVAGYPIILGDC